jgi:hypothetical protein
MTQLQIGSRHREFHSRLAAEALQERDLALASIILPLRPHLL